MLQPLEPFVVVLLPLVTEVPPVDPTVVVVPLPPAADELPLVD
jgi:hypothetical protein